MELRPVPCVHDTAKHHTKAKPGTAWHCKKHFLHPGKLPARAGKISLNDPDYVVKYRHKYAIKGKLPQRLVNTEDQVKIADYKGISSDHKMFYDSRYSPQQQGKQGMDHKRHQFVYGICREYQIEDPALFSGIKETAVSQHKG